MSQAITRCPECQTSFRISEAQLLAAEGNVRCGACMHVFQAEDYFVSPMLDVTELLAIEQDYWADFEQYVEQVSRDRAGIEAGADSAQPEVAMRPRHLIQFSEPVVRPVDAAPHDTGSAAVVGFWQPPSAEAAHVAPDSTGALADTPVQFWSPPGSDRQRSESEHVDEHQEGDEYDESEETDVSADFDIVQYWQPALVVHHQEDDVSLPDIQFMVAGEAMDEDPIDQPLDLSGLELQPDVAELVQDRRRLLSLRGLRWLPGILMMAAIGFAQYAFFNMGHYAQDLRYRAYFETACTYLFCEVPDFASSDDLETRELIIRTHPEADGALIVDLLLRNAAEFRQVFPRLRLQFFNLSGQVIGSRIFAVDEYLGGELRGLKYIPARTEVRISLELVDPGDEATGYEMIVLPR